MSIMDMIDEYIDLKIEGEPKSSEWRSIDANAAARNRYADRLQSLRDQIDREIAATGANHDR